MARTIKSTFIQASGADDQQIYVATTPLSARVVYINICNTSATLPKAIAIYKGVISGALYIIAPATTINPKEARVLHCSIVLEPGEAIYQTAGTGIVTTTTAEEFIQGA